MSTSDSKPSRLTFIKMSPHGDRHDNHESNSNNEVNAADAGHIPDPFAVTLSQSVNPHTQTRSSVDEDKLEREQSSSQQLPRFLTRLHNPFSKEDPLASHTVVESSRALTLASKPSTRTSGVNSFSSIFNKDHQEISGIQRVFKKSIAFMVIDLALFGLLTLISTNLLAVPIWLIVLVWVAFAVVTNIFYIIVADRSYVWLGIAGNLVLLLIVHSFLGQGFDPITLGVAVLISAMTFSAYSELEKIQLGSRLFFISHITGETTRIMTTVVAILFSLGLYSSMVSTGAALYIDKNLLTNQTIMDRVLIGSNRELSLNRVFIKGYRIYGTSSGSQLTFRDFLIDNYRGGRAVLTEAERANIIIQCEQGGGDTAQCQKRVTEERDKRLLEWKRDAYPRLNLELSSTITPAVFEEITRQHYLYLINDFSTTQNTMFNIIPSRNVIPALLSVMLFGFLFVFRIVIGWLVFVCTWITWRILRITGFARIEVEAVEAEIVSI